MRHWTEEIDDAANVLFRTFTTAEIRRRQDLCRAQLATAVKRYDRGETRLIHAIEDLQAMDNALFREMMRRTR